MMIKRILIVLVFLITNCGSKKGIVTKKPKSKTEDISQVDLPQKVDEKETEEPKEITIKDTPEVYASPTEEYIAIYSDIAQEEMRQYGVPASITLAQGILESSSGRGRLAVKANNHFGIKCHDWTGATILHDDDEKGGNGQPERPSFFQPEVPAEIHAGDDVADAEAPEH